MNNVLKKYLSLSWLSLTLTILFFHPLIATLHENVIFLQWRIQNTFELLAAIALLTVILTLFLCCIEHYSNRYFKLAAYFFISIVPLISFGVHFLRQLGYKEELINLGQYANMNKVACLAIGIFIIAFLFFVSAKYPSRILNVILMLLITLSPINILAGWTIWKVRGENRPIYLKKDMNLSRETQKYPHNPAQNIYIFLFDGMSYGLLYNNGVIDSKYSNIKYLSSISDNYHSATAPSIDKTINTLTSIPGLLTGRKYGSVTIEDDTMYQTTKKAKIKMVEIDQNNLFSIAKKNKLKTLLFGSYLPYCELFGNYLDECRSFSIYNYGALETNFSLFNPVLTTLFLWPHQYFQGIIKIRLASKFYKELTEKTIRLTMQALDNPIPSLLFTHFYFLHSPFFFNKNGYYKNKEAYLLHRKNYLNQLDYADQVIGKLIARLKENGKFEKSMIVVLADHNCPFLYPDHILEIPLIIKGINQNHKRDILEPVQAEILLMNKIKSLLSDL